MSPSKYVFFNALTHRRCISAAPLTACHCDIPLNAIPLHGITESAEVLCTACFPAKAQARIEDTLAERGSRYGKFTDHADVTQDLKAIMRRSPKWQSLSNDQAEALEMIQHKIGRILCGDPDFHDSWHDIVGYAKLVADRLASLPHSATVAE